MQNLFKMSSKITRANSCWKIFYETQKLYVDWKDAHFLQFSNACPEFSGVKISHESYSFWSPQLNATVQLNARGYWTGLF